MPNPNDGGKRRNPDRRKRGVGAKRSNDNNNSCEDPATDDKHVRSQSKRIRPNRRGTRGRRRNNSRAHAITSPPTATNSAFETALQEQRQRHEAAAANAINPETKATQISEATAHKSNSISFAWPSRSPQSTQGQLTAATNAPLRIRISNRSRFIWDDEKQRYYERPRGDPRDLLPPTKRKAPINERRRLSNFNFGTKFSASAVNARSLLSLLATRETSSKNGNVAYHTAQKVATFAAQSLKVVDILTEPMVSSIEVWPRVLPNIPGAKAMLIIQNPTDVAKEYAITIRPRKFKQGNNSLVAVVPPHHRSQVEYVLGEDTRIQEFAESIDEHVTVVNRYPLLIGTSNKALTIMVHDENPRINRQSWRSCTAYWSDLHDFNPGNRISVAVPQTQDPSFHTRVSCGLNGVGSFLGSRNHPGLRLEWHDWNNGQHTSSPPFDTKAARDITAQSFVLACHHRDSYDPCRKINYDFAGETGSQGLVVGTLSGCVYFFDPLAGACNGYIRSRLVYEKTMNVMTSVFHLIDATAAMVSQRGEHCDVNSVIVGMSNSSLLDGIGEPSLFMLNMADLPQRVVVYEGHKSNHRIGSQVQLTPSGSLLLACNYTGEILIWLTATGGAPVTCVPVSVSPCRPLLYMTIMESHRCFLHVWVSDLSDRVHYIETDFLCDYV